MREDLVENVSRQIEALLRAPIIRAFEHELLAGVRRQGNSRRERDGKQQAKRETRRGSPHSAAPLCRTGGFTCERRNGFGGGGDFPAPAGGSWVGPAVGAVASGGVCC